ncbi:hypothetical protein Kpol_1032p58 [Vanderwaltozyma polyspora DSM 70294]|uniref:non-specific serine/threonine protein kinase n=1 Tax=Vanderwaltozyma polyspora (strain ATCC 22028 / DSM 70294 / BCRC 21397 / CBS 2163 / NBRC 10782 / NRRL Y-8283 / UCD 57-17) TaxID=436907 RepID=A7TH12_VANPO|nr:uncharacterized protein Kpol_1032p58 [Vanderwaltozyma polyspora DSM 70294]EDO18464.1 hypothetical protein Kpol_1032p58 [Vanderwaltozyma polyspora DSM 70294]
MDSSRSLVNLSPGKNFIAMVISDNESDDTTSDDYSGLKSSVSPVASSGFDISGDRKRQSMVSSGSSKKRWSSLSSYGTKQRISGSDSVKSNKRVSMYGMGSSETGGHFADVGVSNNSITIPTLVRTSTDSPIKQLFTKISISDENNENRDNRKSRELSLHGKPVSELFKVNSYAKRSPLAPLQNENSSKIQHNKTNNIYKVPENTSIKSIFGGSIEEEESNRSNPSKWKFWKRNSLSRIPTTNRNTGDTRGLERHSFVEPQLSNRSSLSSNYNLKKKSSSSSLSLHGLKHKTSHTSLKNLKNRKTANNMILNDNNGNTLNSTSTHNNSNTHNTHNTNNNNNNNHNNNSIAGKMQISLPVPDQASCDRIKTKLQHSTSIVSLQSHISEAAINKIDYDNRILHDILEYCDVKYVMDQNTPTIMTKSLYKLPKENKKLSSNVWRFFDKASRESIILKKLSLNSFESAQYTKEMCLQELTTLRLCKDTMGLPLLLQSYIFREVNSEVPYEENTYLMIFMKDHGSPLSSYVPGNWKILLNIFWQLTTTLYVMENKFEFEHRNLTTDHILVDKLGNITICDFKSCRFKPSSDRPSMFTRLDHSIFFQGGNDYQYEIYDLMRALLPDTSYWRKFEPKTNLIWLHYALVKLKDIGEKNKCQGGEKEAICILSNLLEPFNFPLSNSSITSCGDLLSLRKRL